MRNIRMGDLSNLKFKSTSVFMKIFKKLDIDIIFTFMCILISKHNFKIMFKIYTNLIIQAIKSISHRILFSFTISAIPRVTIF